MRLFGLTISPLLPPPPACRPSTSIQTSRSPIIPPGQHHAPAMPVIQRMTTDQGLPHRQHDIKRLAVVFVAWKTLLVLLAIFTPGPGYDTSGFVALTRHDPGRVENHSPSLSDRLALSHLRWDALYFVKAAQRGYLYEQEWAFSRAHSLTVQTVTDCRFPTGFSTCPSRYSKY